ncbi:phage tail tape measure protein [Lactobacillus taiwanensis]|uniref:phage tail tape measure protein n=1 Tax=Lactobacillus taiwanensis TaxID=508451 RepID=UPI00214CF468|nr:phage tail tape measure protein [Lactobacillus taiwanensis]MCR1904043.1 phage tail tape measure protein [Lactobacillus taiwanensis]
MPTISGYKFVIDLEDRGVTMSLRNMKAAAQALKAEMRANFSILQSGEGSFAAYSQKVTDASHAIEQYGKVIANLNNRLANYGTKLTELRNQEAEQQATLDKLKNSNEENTKQYKDAEKALTKTKNSIQSLTRSRLSDLKNLQTQRAAQQSLIEQQKRAEETLKQLRTGMADYQRISKSVLSVNKSYVSSMKETGHYFKANSANIKTLKLAHQSLASQYKAEKDVAHQLELSTTTLYKRYDQERSALTRINYERNRARNELKQLTSQYGSNSTQAKNARDKVEQLNTQYTNQERRLTGLREKVTQSTEAYSKQAVQAGKTADQLVKVQRATSGFKATGLGRLTTSVGQFNTKLKESTSHTREWASSLKGGFAAVSAGAVGVTAGLGKVTSMAGEMQQKWVTAKNLMVTGGEKAAEVTENLALMQKDAAKYSKEYGISQSEIADQYTNLIKRGYDSKSALGAMKDELEATRATGDEFSDVVDSASQALDAFGLRTSDTAQMAKNTHRVLNAMAYSADLTATSFKDLSTGMAYVSAPAKQAGWDIEQTSAALGMLSNAGVEGSQAGTGLRKVIVSLTKPTKGAAAALKEAGLSIKDFQDKSGQLKPVDEIFKSINQKVAGWGSAKKGAFFKSIFGATGMQAASILAQTAGGLKANDDQLTQLIANSRKAEEGSGYVHQLAQKNMQTTKMQLERLKMTFQDLAINMGKQMLPAINNVADAFSKWSVSKDGQDAIKGISSAVGDVANAVSKHSKDIMGFFSGIVQGAKTSSKWIGNITKSISDFFNYTPVIKDITKNIKDFFKWANTQMGGNKNNNAFVRFAGQAVGALATLAVPLLAVRKTAQGIRAILLDVGQFKNWITGNKIVDARAREMKRVVTLQEQSLKLTQQQIELEKKNRGWGDTNHSGEHPTNKGTTTKTDIVEDIADAVDTVADMKGGEGDKVAKNVEKMGERHAHFWQRGFLGKLKGWGSSLVSALNPTNLIQKFANFGDKLGNLTAKKFVAKIKSIISKLNPLPLIKKFGAALKAGLSKLNPKNWHILQTMANVGDKAGSRAGNGFVSKFKGVLSKLNPLNWFKRNKGVSVAAEKAGAEAGTKATTGFLGKLKGSKILGAIKGVGSDLFHGFFNGWSLAFGLADNVFDIINGIKEKNPDKKARELGSGIGGGIGAGVGAILGSVFPGIGTLAGAVLGQAIGTAAGNYAPEILHTASDVGQALAKGWKGTCQVLVDLAHGNFSKAWKDASKGFHQFSDGMVKYFDEHGGKGVKSWVGKSIDTIKKGNWKGAWNNTVNSAKSAWGGFTSWFDKNILGKTKKATSNSSKSPSTKGKKVVSLSKARASKQDIANIKSMTAALKAYTTALSGLKATVKKNDPSTIVNNMNKSIINSTKGWDKAAQPIKKMGDAFKYLATFAKAMAKKDVFKAFNTDLPKLDKTLKTHVNSLKTNLNKLGDALKGGKKGNGIEKYAKKIVDALAKLTDKAKKVNSPIKTLKSSFSSLKSSLSGLVGKGSKNTLFDRVGRGLDRMQTKFYHVLRGKNSIQNLIDKLVKSLKDSKLDNLLTKIETPLKKIASDLEKMSSPMKNFSKAMSTLSSTMKVFQTTKGQKNPLDAMVESLENLKKALAGGKTKTAVVKELQDLTKAFAGSGGKKSTGGFVSALKKVNDPLKKLSGYFKDLNKPLDSFNKSIAAFTGKGKKSNPLENMASGFSDLKKVFDTKKGSKGLADQIKEMGEAFGGNGKKSVGLADKITKTNKPLDTFTSSLKSVANNIKPVNSGIKSFSDLLSAFAKKSNALDKFASSLKSLNSALKKYPFGDTIKDEASTAYNALKDYNFAKEFSSQVSSLKSRLSSFKSAFNKSWKNLWDNLHTVSAKGLDRVDTSLYRGFKQLQSRASTFYRSFKRGWSNWIDDIQTMFYRGVNKLPGYASSAMQDVIGKMNRGIGGVNKVIGEFGGDKKLGTIRYADGTHGGHPGGHMLVNDSQRPHWKELVKFPHRPWMMFNDRNTLIPNAPAGTQVLSGEDTHKVMSSMGIRHYADGTDDTLDPDKAEKIMDAIDKNPLGELKKYFYGATNFNGSPFVSDFGPAISNAFLNAIKDPFKKAIDEFGGQLANPAGAGVSRWIPVIKRAAKVMHVNLTAAGLSKILSNMQHESGGNPTIVQTVDDINMRRGDPAIGLFQFIQETFRAYAVRGHGNIRSGYDQILALFNDRTWFSDIAPGGGWGPTGGRRYANGGFSYAHQLAEISENNKPEAIIPLDLSKRPRAYQILSQIISGFAKDEPDNGGFGSAGTSVLQDEIDSLNDKFDALISLMTELVNGDRVTNINVDGRTIARATNSAFRAQNALDIERKRRGFSGV